MTRKCNCAGGCGPQDDGITRREFVTLLGTGTAGALLSGTASPAAARQAARDKAEELAQWKRNLRTAATRVYRSDTHGDARMPLGGIGTGNVDLGVDGQFTTWQLFNTLRDGYVPFFFGIKAGNAARILQTAGGPPGLPSVQRIEMTGEYPMATLRFQDAALPVQVEMTAFSPFAPFDERRSSLPTAAFVFRVHNPTKTAQDVSLGAFLQNPLGYDALGPAISFNSVGFNQVAQKSSVYHPNFGGNVNRIVRDGKATTLAMHLEPGPPATLSEPLTLYTNVNVGDLNQFAVERPDTLRVQGMDMLPQNGATALTTGHTVVWLEDAAQDFAEPYLRAARVAASAGATVVFSGSTLPLLDAYAQAKNVIGHAQTATDILFEDFESGYDGWTVQGDAFGTEPVTGTLPNQQDVSGFRGNRLVNSYRNGDDATGRLSSKSFVIERNYIRFLVGGGSFPNTQIRLIVGGKTVQAASGKNEERLLPALWDVRSLRGQTAHIEIVDEQKGGWGHINVDHIEFSDLPFSHALLGLLDEMLPAQFTSVRSADTTAGVTLDGLTLRDGAKNTVTHDGVTAIARAFGKGRVVLVMRSLLSPNETALIGARQRAYTALAEIAKVECRIPETVPATAPGFGTLALTAMTGDATTLPVFTDWQTAWATFAAQGRFDSLDQKTPTPTPPGQTVNGALASQVNVPAGKTVEVVYHLSWHFPNKYHDGDKAQSIGNYYTTLWPDAQAVSREVTSDFAKLHEATETFRATFYDSTLPYWLLDCVSSQISTIRHVGVVFRTANSDIYGWEGSNGCCPPTCTHVWGYEQTLSRLFPALERDMRRIDFLHQQRPDGGINNRTAIPSPSHPTGEQPFSDGHASSVLKLYREVLNNSDDGYLKTYWPHAKRAVEYLVARDAATTPGGAGPDGTLSDDQWNTYDNAIHGVNSFIGTYYLAALRAGEEMARRVGESDTAERFHQVFLKGRENLVKRCWNGEYFQQNLPGYDKRAGEYGPGCLSDQLIGQWWAHQLGLGYVLPREYVQTALKAVYKYNFLTDHSNFQHNWRKFAGGTDKGLLVCTWPKGGRPANTIPYVDEVWTGVEYQVAGHLIYEGLIDEAFAIIKGARDRYDGVPRAPIPRNPWNEIECGGHYARAMSSWALLLGLSGFQYDAPAQAFTVAPRLTPAKFKSFFSGPVGWGSVSQTRRSKSQRNEVTVVAGSVPVKRLHLEVPVDMTARRVRVTVGEKATDATLTQDGARVTVTLNTPVTVPTGKTLVVMLS